MRDEIKMIAVVLLLGFVASARGHGVATSSQSMVSGEGWRYGYGIAHGPPGIGHAVGESYPHGYGGFGTYAPSYGYNLAPPPPPPPPAVVLQKPIYRPIPIVQRPPTYWYPNYRPLTYYYYDEDDDHDDYVPYAGPNPYYSQYYSHYYH